MAWLRFVVVVAFAFSIVVLPPRPASAATCSFVLGFKAIDNLIPTTVGVCLVDEHHNAVNGDGLQETAGPTGAGGLLVWRKADNHTAYTDGYHTWVNGPKGLQERLNTQRFPFEADFAQFAPAPGTPPVPAPAPPAPSAGVAFTFVVGASPGRIAQAWVQTSPFASCSIDYWTPQGTHGVAAGLYPQTANAQGLAGWAWFIGGNTYPGVGTVTVTCNGASASTKITIG